MYFFGFSPVIGGTDLYKNMVFIYKIQIFGLSGRCFFGLISSKEGFLDDHKEVVSWYTSIKKASY